MCCGSATLYGSDALEQAALLNGTDISHTLSSYFQNIIGLVQQVVRFVTRTEPKASYQMVQYEYAYRYIPNMYVCIYMYMYMYMYTVEVKSLQTPCRICKMSHNILNISHKSPQDYGPVS